MSFDVPSLALAEARAQTDPRYAGIVVDAASGEVLYAEDADSRRHPASLTKMMTLYLLFEEIEAGRLRHDDAAQGVSRTRRACRPRSSG